MKKLLFVLLFVLSGFVLFSCSKNDAENYDDAEVYEEEIDDIDVDDDEDIDEDVNEEDQTEVSGADENTKAGQDDFEETVEVVSVNQ